MGTNEYLLVPTDLDFSLIDHVNMKKKYYPLQLNILEMFLMAHE